MKHLFLSVAAIIILSCNQKQPEILSMVFPDVETTDQVGFAAALVPTFTVRLVNPQLAGNVYTVDVEFKTSVQGTGIYASNFRFWFDSQDFSNVVKFKGFQGGYNTYLPTSTNGITPVFVLPRSYANWFNFEGNSIFANGSFGLRSVTPILLSATDWTKLFQVELVKIGPDAFPEIVLDLEADPLRGGFLSGSSGIVITVVTGANLSAPANEGVVQYNWKYTGTGLIPPYGQPIN